MGLTKLHKFGPVGKLLWAMISVNFLPKKPNVIIIKLIFLYPYSEKTTKLSYQANMEDGDIKFLHGRFLYIRLPSH